MPEAVAEVPLFEEQARPSKGDLYTYLSGNRGNISEAARHFGQRRATIKDMINTTPELVALMEDLSEGQVDKAEDNIFADNEKGDQGASKFILQTKGKKRGWAMGVEGTGKEDRKSVV